MSQHKKSRKHNSGSIWPWLITAAAILVIGIVGLFLMSQNNRSALESASTPEVTGAPGIAIVQDSFDYGDVKLGNTVETVFKVRNVGDQDLVILKQPVVQVVEGCCPPKAVLSSSVIKPGQQGTVTVQFMMHEGMGGKHRFNIDLQTNDPKQPVKQLVILSNWIS